jgi:hypothetical protein
MSISIVRLRLPWPSDDHDKGERVFPFFVFAFACRLTASLEDLAADGSNLPPIPIALIQQMPRCDAGVFSCLLLWTSKEVSGREATSSTPGVVASALQSPNSLIGVTMEQDRWREIASPSMCQNRSVLRTLTFVRLRPQ